jgi:hypothetical protein
MGRLRMTLAAAVITGMVVVAVAALDAVGADKVNANDGLAMQFATCLRDRGVAVPNLGVAELDRWFATHRLPEATARACKTAVAPPYKARAATADAEKLAACLRAHGLQPPTDPVALKEWIGAHHGETAVARALEQCGFGPPPPACGDKDNGPTLADALKKATLHDSPEADGM